MANKKCIQDVVELVPWKVLKGSDLRTKTSNTICYVTEILIEVAITQDERRERIWQE